MQIRIADYLAAVLTFASFFIDVMQFEAFNCPSDRQFFMQTRLDMTAINRRQNVTATHCSATAALQAVTRLVETSNVSRLKNNS
jgi:hypothetical protein